MKFKENIVIPSLTKLDATTTIPWEIVCYFDRERKTKPITQSKHIVFDVKKYSCFIRKYTTSVSYKEKLSIDGSQNQAVSAQRNWG